MRDPGEIIDDLRAATDLGDNQPLPDLVLELVTCILVYRVLPTDFFEKLKALLVDDGFRALDDSWRLVHFVDDNWNLLAPDQREGLRDALVGGFDGFRNFMGAFVIGEMLGARYGDERALDALLRLSKAAEMPALALVPHGLETLARSTGDARLRDRAVQRLKELGSSSVEEVRKEAGISLGKVGRPLGPR